MSYIWKSYFWEFHTATFKRSGIQKQNNRLECLTVRSKNNVGSSFEDENWWYLCGKSFNKSGFYYFDWNILLRFQILYSWTD